MTEQSNGAAERSAHVDRGKAKAAGPDPFVGPEFGPIKIRALAEAEAEIERLRNAYTVMNDEICQRLGKALGYPWFKDDQVNFPGATEENGVCTGEHVAESIASEAASYIKKLEAELAALRARNGGGDGEVVRTAGS